ncbi:MAG: hypothetical protein DMG14_16565 [Acidobacteria bacterium]|nr:MAG: hypothetical protein DMG14_16565 [Acidobacteriota bacterium]
MTRVIAIFVVSQRFICGPGSFSALAVLLQG